MAISTAAPGAADDIPNCHGLPEVPFAAFAASPRWVAVKFIEHEKRGKPVKVPRSAYDGYASVTAPHTWSTLDMIAPTRTLPWSRGVVGFVLTDLPAEELSAIDLDHVLTANSDFVHDLVCEIVSEAVAAGCYIEVTPSRQGLRILGRVNAQGQRWETTPAPIDPNIPEAGNVEFYAYPTARYITVTGDAFRPVPGELGDMTELFLRLAQRAGALPGAVKREKDQNASLPPICGWDQPEEIERYRDWLRTKAPQAIERSGGERATCDVILIGHDYGLRHETVFRVLAESGGWNETKASPPWALEELEKKVETRIRNAQLRPGRLTAAGQLAADLEHASTAYGNVVVLPLPESAKTAAPPREPEKTATPSNLSWFRHGDPLPDEPQWLIPGILPASGVGFITGPRNSGKSFLALTLASCLATGKPFFSKTPAQTGGTIMVIAEGHRGAKIRLTGLGDLRNPQPISLLLSRACLDNPEELKELGYLLAQECKRRAAESTPVRAVMIDTLAATGALSADENSNGVAARFVAAIAAMAIQLNVVCILLHHPPKGGKGLRGGGALEGAADFILEIELQGKNSFRTVEMEKSRDGATGPLGAFRLVPSQVGTDRFGASVTTCALEFVDEKAASGMGKRPGNYDQFLNAFSLALEKGGEDAPETAGRYVEENEVRARFKSLKQGSRDKDNVNKAFRDCRDYAVKIGHVAMDPYRPTRLIEAQPKPPKLPLSDYL